MAEDIQVSVCVMTYNHAPFIRECLDSILNQKTSFSFEVIVNDDCSTDGTTEIVREFENKYPGIIIPVYHKHNLYREFKNAHKDYYNHIMFPMARGKYIACCDGDDYWLTDNKLQRQYNIMESNPNYSLCHHSFLILKDGALTERLYKSTPTQNLEEAAYSAHIQTTSMFFRNPHQQLVPEDFDFKHTIYQFFWAIRLAEFGDVYYIDEPLSVARQHVGGSFNGSDSHQRFIMSLGNIDNMIDWYKRENSVPNVVRALKRRGRKTVIPYILSSIKRFRLKDAFMMIKWSLKYC